jgi:hypothetical protein
VRSYRCTSSECAEVFSVERGRDVGLPVRLLCCFCGRDAKASDFAGAIGQQSLRENGRESGAKGGQATRERWRRIRESAARESSESESAS